MMDPSSWIKSSSGSSEPVAQQLSLTCTGHTRAVVHLSFSKLIGSGEYYLLDASTDGTSILRRGDTTEWIGTFHKHKGAIWSCKLSADALLSVTGSADFSAQVWDNHTGMSVLYLPHGHVVRCVDLSQDSKYVMTASLEKEVKLFDVKSGKTFTQLKGFSTDISSAVLDSDTGLVFCADGNVCRIFDLRNNQQLLSRFFNSPISLKRSMDDRHLLVWEESVVHAYRIKLATQLHEMAVNFPVSAASFNESLNKMIISSAKDFNIRVFDTVTHTEQECYGGHHGKVNYIAYSPDGLLYASASDDGTVRLWQTYPGTPYGPWRT